jgi:hypothetical protein
MKRAIPLLADYPLKFRHLDEHLTHEHLNEGYGKYSMFFKNRVDAELYAQKYRKPRITRIFDGVGNKQYLKGFLVTTTEGGVYDK